MHDVVHALAVEGEALTLILRGLPASAFDRPTNCPPWTVAELVVHVADSVRIQEFPPAPSTERIHEAADYYRRPERSTSAYRRRNVRLAQTRAASLDDQTPGDYFATALKRIVTHFGDADVERVVAVDRIGAMRLSDWLISRVVAVAAHGVDVALSLSRTPCTTQPALSSMRPVLVSLLGAEPSAELGWNDQLFFEAATGRRDLTGAERRLLGPRAHRFPVLS